MATSAAPSSAQNLAQLRAANMAARQLITSSAVDFVAPIVSGALSYSAGQPTVVNVPVRPLGLVKRFWIEISGTLNCAGTHTLTKSMVGMPNLLSQVTLTDLNNQTRVSTAGWHLHYLASVRRQLAFGAAFTNSDPSGMGANWPIMNAPTPIAGGTAQNFRWFFEIPVAYSDNDLTGAIYANVINAQCNLQFTINPLFFAASGTDRALAGYYCDSTVGTTAPTLTNLQYTVYQNSLDQLPVDSKSGQFVLPVLDLEYAYLLLNTNVGSLIANQPQSIPYANWRSFFSTFLLWDNYGFNGANGIGSDVTSIQLQTANFTNTFNIDPYLSALMTRTKINDDLPAAVGANEGATLYYIDTRNKPVNTVQYGNMSLQFQPSVVQSANSALYICYEAVALQGAMQQAGSIYQV